MKTNSRKKVVKAGFVGMMAAFAVLASGCVFNLRAPVVPPPGALYTSYKAPLDYQLGKHHNDDTPSIPISQMRSGTSETSYIQLIYPTLSLAFEDASVETAARNGGITTVHFADYEVLSVLGLYVNTKVTVYGE